MKNNINNKRQKFTNGTDLLQNKFNDITINSYGRHLYKCGGE